jgi:hypothetical protein
LLRGVVAGVAVAALIGGGAYAQDQEAATGDCDQQLIQTQALVQGKVDANTLSEDEQEAIYEILDNADALCADGKSDEANATLAAVSKMIGGSQ